MVSPKIEEKLSNLSAEYIYNEGIGNLLLLAISYTDRKKGEDGDMPFGMPEEIKKIRDKTDSYIPELEDILGNNELRISALNEVLELKKQLVSLYGNVYDYFSQWNTLSLAVNDETAIRKYKEQHLADKKVQYEVFYTDCVNFLTASENIDELRKYTAQLLKCMPMRMARGRFFDIVLRSLRAAFAGATEETITKSIDAFKKGCAPVLDKNYGKLFPEIAEWLASKADHIPAHMSDEELADEYEDFNMMLDTIQQAEDGFTALYDDLNSLIIVLYLSFTFEELTEKDAAYADLYHAVCDIMTGETSEEEAEALLDTLKEQLEAAIEPIIDKVNSINEKELELMDKIGTMSELSEETQKSIGAEGFIRGIYYSNINDELFDFEIDENSPVASKEFSEKVFAEFIDYMQEYYKTLPMQIRKSNMLILLGSIPVAMDIADTIDYVKSSVENCIDEEQKILIVDKAGMVFDANGFSYADEDFDDDECGCNHDHHHHHHDHDCECGHDHHHHDYDCECGNDHHHHDHDCECGHDHHHHDHDCDCGHDHH